MNIFNLERLDYYVVLYIEKVDLLLKLLDIKAFMSPLIKINYLD